MTDAFVTGYALTATLIVAIGAQNLHVLRHGLARLHVGLVVGLCIAADAILVGLGTAGVARAAGAHPTLLQAAAWAGAAFLLVYAAASLRRALKPAAGGAEAAATVDVSAAQAGPPPAASGATPAAAPGARRTAAATLAVTLLNPHVYLDTVLLAGTVGAQQPSPAAFVGGAALASATWFVGLGYGARLLQPLFRQPAAWRVLDGLIAVTMAAIAASLVFG